MKVLVLERRHVVGGAAVSEEIFPGYVFSRGAYLLSLLRKNIIDDLFPKDWRKELVLFEREYPSFTPTHKEGEYLLLGHKDELKEIAKFSKKDAERYPEYVEKLDEIVDMINPFIDNAPPQGLMETLKLAAKIKKPKK